MKLIFPERFADQIKPDSPRMFHLYRQILLEHSPCVFSLSGKRLPVNPTH